MSIREQADKTIRALRIREDELTVENVEQLRNSRGHWDDIDCIDAAELIELIRLCKETLENGN